MLIRFLLRHVDNDLDHLLEESVPPVALDRIGAFRAVIAKHRKKAATGCFDSLFYCSCWPRLFLL